MKKNIKDDFESLGKEAGKKIGQDMSERTGEKIEEIGQKIGKTLGEQVGRASETIQKETVTKEEQLGIGGKIGTGIGIVGKKLVEKKYGFLSKWMGAGDLVSEGRVAGAKAEKIVKRLVKKQVGKLSADKEEKD